MAKIFKPRRALRSSVKSGSKRTLVLASGELMLVGKSAIGESSRADLYLGDGVSQMQNLSPAMYGDTSEEDITITDDTSTTASAALGNVTTGKTLGAILGSLKKAISLNAAAITTLNDDVGNIVANNAGAHNAFHRGRNLTSDWNSGTFSTNVANGSYKNIFPGDYIQRDITIDGVTTTNMTFYVAHLGYYGTGCVMFPGTNMLTAQMNSTNTTAGGYIGSDMYKNTIPKLDAAVKGAFGSSRVTAITVYYPNSFKTTSAGEANGWKDYSVYCTLPTECQIYGGQIWADNGYEFGYEAHQLAVFRHNKRFNGGSGFWLRNVSKYNNYASAFCNCSNGGFANLYGASASLGVRPLFNLT